jgi:Fe-S oxidoreductase
MFILMVAICLVATFYTFRDMFAIIGRGDGRLHFEKLPRRLVAGIGALFAQGGMLRRRKLTSLIHFGVAWGFIFYFLVNAVDVLEGFITGFEIPGVAGDIYRLLADVLSVVVLVGVAYFILRRFTFGDPALKTRDNVLLMDKARAGIPRDSLVVGLFILLHVGFRFLSQTFAVGLEGGDAWQPFASWVSGLWTGLSAAQLEFGFHLSWWVALGLIFLFLPYFPYTKHAHLFMGPLNFMTRPERRSMGELNAIDFEDESIEQFGVGKLTDLSQTQILDAFACIMCNRCQDACPAYFTGKELSPAALEINKRYYLRENLGHLGNGGADDPRLLDYAISESALWACTSCGACVEVCPVGNEPMRDILQIRRDRVLMESDFPGDLQGAFRGMERLGNPWGTTEDRLTWTQPLPFDVPTVEDNPDFDVLYWVGCAGAFDPKAQEMARAMATVLNAAGINYAILGHNESCTGDSARRAGNEYLFFEMALGNIELLNEFGVDKKRIVTGCPHCFHTIRNEYPALGGNYEVMHHTQFIGDLIGRGQLRLNGKALEQTTFHDPCYLGRHNEVYDAPREALAKAGTVLLEMDRSRSNSFCCGAGGAQMWKEEEHGQQAVNVNRYQEAQTTGAKTLAVGCPFCARMLDDANKEHGESMVIKDVAEVIVEAIA